MSALSGAGILTIKVNGAADLRRGLNDVQYRRALGRAVNKAGRAGRTDLSKQIRGEIALPASVIRSSIKLVRAARGQTEARLVITRKPIPLKEYKARETKKGVTVKVRRKEPREVHKRAFIAESVGGHVFERKKVGDKRVGRLPIDKRFGPTVLGVLQGKPGFLPEFETDLTIVLAKRAREEVNFELLKIRRRTRRA